MRKILYYPTINIPNQQWLRHAVLYYDQVSSIIPQDWDQELFGKLSRDIHYLINEEQFEPVRPETLVYGNNWDAFEGFQQEFREIVQAPGYIERINRTPKLSFGRLHVSKAFDNEFYQIHSNKITDGLFYFLEDLGLAHRSENPQWLLFEKGTALLYMSLLAKYLADIDEQQTTIGTDLKVYENFNFRKVNDNQDFPVVSLSLENILPTPRFGVPMQRIVELKRRRAENLNHFKKIISDFQVKISKTQSQSEFKETCVTFKETLTNGVNDLSAVLHDGRIETVQKGLKSLISLKSPAAVVAAGVAISEQLQLNHIPFNYEAFSIGALGMVEIAGCYIDARNKVRARLRESPFSYLYYAERKRIINRSS